MKYKNLLSVLATVILAVGLIGCGGCKASLESGGAYAPATTNAAGVVTPTQAPDLAFYNVDAAYALSYSTVDAAFTFEKNNRAMLWKISPQIKHALDSIRPQAAQANISYLRARASYLANPIPAGLTQLQTLLAQISNLATAAQAATAVPTTTPVTTTNSAPTS